MFKWIQSQNKLSWALQLSQLFSQKAAIKLLDWVATLAPTGQRSTEILCYLEVVNTQCLINGWIEDLTFTPNISQRALSLHSLPWKSLGAVKNMTCKLDGRHFFYKVCSDRSSNIRLAFYQCHRQVSMSSLHVRWEDYTVSEHPEVAIIRYYPRCQTYDNVLKSQAAKGD